MISFSFPRDRQPKPVRIVYTGQVWRVYAPGASYTMLSRKTLRGAKALAARQWPSGAVQVVE